MKELREQLAKLYMPADPNQPEDLRTKVLKVVCCYDGCCWGLCDDCCQEKRKPRLEKKDIVHQHIAHQPLSQVHSDASHSSHLSQAGSVVSSRYDKSDSVSSYSSFRDRMDSENSSRKGSTSSNPDRRSTPTPIIDMKPIEFWAANREAVQPRTPRRRLPSESEISIEELKLDLYESSTENTDECLTDEQKLSRYQLGQIHFSLQYDIPNKLLLIRIIEARDLPLPLSKDDNKQDLAHSNPYAKVCLLPDQKNSKQTPVQRKTQEPCWGEVFTWEMPFKEAQRRILEITVKDFDKYSRHCIIGHVHIPLANVNLIKGGHMWKPLAPCSKDQPDLGELLLSLNYLPTAGRLNVDIIKAKQLLQTDLVGGSDPYVKISLLMGERVTKSRKTSIKKNTIDPVFNESMSFNVSPDMLDTVSLVVTVWDHNGKSKDDFVGRIIMGKQSTGPYEITHWNRMMHCQRSPVAQWHTLRTREEGDQVCPLSAIVT